ncbi:MAG: hypothetical protein QXX68_00005 [Candidatus Pacearchaeota archaeon]
MKKTILIASLFILVSTLSLIAAEEFVSSQEILLRPAVDPAVVSEAENSLNEDVSGFDLFKERLALRFTFNKEKRAERELKLAGMLLNRARIAARNNNTKAMEKAIEEHNRLMERVKQRVEESNRKNMSSEKLEGLDRAIQVHEIKIERFTQRLQNENLSEKQKENIEKMLNNSQKSIEVLNQLRELREERKEIRESFRNNLSEEKARIKSEIEAEKERLRERIRSNLSQEEARE